MDYDWILGGEAPSKLLPTGLRQGRSATPETQSWKHQELPPNNGGVCNCQHGTTIYPPSLSHLVQQQDVGPNQSKAEISCDRPHSFGK